MRGLYHIRVQNNMVRYDFDIRRNITIIRGDSATGKTQLISMLEAYQQDGVSSGIELYCEVPISVIYSYNWHEAIVNHSQHIFFIDEGQSFVCTEEFARVLKDADAYFVIITRQNLDNLPYSVNEIYGIRVSGKYRGLKQTYNELYHLYGDGSQSDLDVKVIITEDSNAGYSFFEKSAINDIACESSSGKPNISHLLNSKRDIGVLVIADGAAFGPQMESLMRLIDNGQPILLYLPESFEWLILSSDVIADTEIIEILSHPWDYIDSEKYMSWERFFTAALVSKAKDTYLSYNKSQLNENYLQPRVRDKILKQLPDRIRRLFKSS